MGIRSTIMAASSVLLLGAGAVSAADLNSGVSYGSMKDGGYMPSIATQPSWYVRLDGSYANYDTPKITEDGIDTLTEPDIDGSWAFGGGVGKYFTSAIRGELTYERRFEADVRGTLGHPGATLPGVRRFGIESDVMMANLYYDFGDRAHFSPYIGIGLGVARNNTTAGVVTDTCGCGPGTIEEGDTWSAAGALMAGFSVNMTHGLHLDTGYRFLYLGEAETGPVRAAGAPISDDPKVEEIHAHELRVGLRYDIH